SGAYSPYVRRVQPGQFRVAPVQREDDELRIGGETRPLGDQRSSDQRRAAVLTAWSQEGQIHSDSSRNFDGRYHVAHTARVRSDSFRTACVRPTVTSIRKNDHTSGGVHPPPWRRAILSSSCQFPNWFCAVLETGCQR